MFRKKPQYVANPYVQPPAAAQPGPSLDNTIHDANMRTDNLDSRICDLERKIAGFKKEMKLNRPGTSAHNTAKRRALQALRQKKSLESRAEIAANSQFNLEQVRDAQVTQRENLATVHGMKQATKDLRRANQQIDIDQVEDIQDEMNEVLEDVQQVNEVLGRQYDVDNIDQSELEAELDELEDDAVNYVSSEIQGEAPQVLPHHQAPQPQQSTQSIQYQQHPAYAANPQGGKY